MSLFLLFKIGYPNARIWISFFVKEINILLHLQNVYVYTWIHKRRIGNENKKLKSDSAPQLISLFSGCGGLDLGFEKAGFKLVWANDFDADAQAVYKLNIGEIDGRDILSVNEDEVPYGDILTAGFPCQPFSNAGNRKGVHDSRGMLYKECLRIIEHRMPKVIVLKM